MLTLKPPDLLYFFILIVYCFQFTKKNRLRVPVMILIFIAMIVQVIGANRDLSFILGTICMVVVSSSYAIHKEGKLKLPIIIFGTIFLITQAIGYGFDIIWLKVYLSSVHVSISFASIAISTIMTFMINYIITNYSERLKN